MESFITSILHWIYKSETVFFFVVVDHSVRFVQGASADWWNHMHFQHHSKPNVMDKDPDTRVEPIFVLGDKLPVRVRIDSFFFEEQKFHLGGES